MEITKIQVKVKTLNKSIFNQLESTKEWHDNCVIGWVNDNGFIRLIVKAGNYNEQLMKVDWINLWDKIASKNTSSPVEVVREAVKKYYHKYDQIII